ncbi:MAG: DUF4097 domain-containing protein, partial [Magnetococcales bacterium]|nr:DUF4097 domain-containing protein [Magnetococcales bacterium]
DLAFHSFTSQSGTIALQADRLIPVNSATVTAPGGVTLVQGEGDVTLQATDTPSSYTVTVADGLFTVTTESDLSLQAGSGQLETLGDITTNGDMVLEAYLDLSVNGLLSAGGDISLTAGGTIAVSLLTTDDGQIILHAGTHEADGAIVDQRSDEGVNLSTQGKVVLQAAANIGNSGDADIDLQAGEVEALSSGNGTIFLNALTNLNLGAAGIQTHGDGEIHLQAAGDVLLTRVSSESGNITIQAGQAIVDNSEDEGVNIASAATLTLEANTGMGDYDAFDINTDVLTLNALNRLEGHIIIANEGSLAIGDQGVLQMAPEGWVVLYSKHGKLAKGKVLSMDEQPVLRLQRMSGLSKPALQAIMAGFQAATTTLTIPMHQDSTDLFSQKRPSEQGDFTMEKSIKTLLLPHIVANFGSNSVSSGESMVIRATSSPFSSSKNIFEVVFETESSVQPDSQPSATPQEELPPLEEQVSEPEPETENTPEETHTP